MRNLIVTTVMTSLLTSYAMAEAQTSLIIEADYNEDRSMFMGDYPNDNITPFISVIQNVDGCIKHKDNGTIILFAGKEGDNICNYPTITYEKLSEINADYCEIAIDFRGGDIDLELAEEQGCFINDDI